MIAIGKQNCVFEDWIQIYDQVRETKLPREDWARVRLNCVMIYETIMKVTQ